MGMLELRGELDFALEPFDVDAGREFGRQDFDDHLPLQRPFGRQEYTGHASATQLPVNLEVGVEGFLEALGEVGVQDRRRQTVCGRQRPGRASLGWYP